MPTHIFMVDVHALLAAEGNGFRGLIESPLQRMFVHYSFHKFNQIATISVKAHSTAGDNEQHLKGGGMRFASSQQANY